MLFKSLCLPLSLGTFAQYCDLAECRPSNKRFQFGIGPCFQMETLAAPGISHGSIMHCQDWGRLLCQSNVVDPHHEHPPAYTASFWPAQCVCENVCVCIEGAAGGSWILTGCCLWNQPSQGFISFSSGTELSFLIVDELLAHTRSYRDHPSLSSPSSISPTPLPRLTTPPSKVKQSLTLCDVCCSSTVQMHPPPFVMSFYVLLRRSNMRDVLLVELISKLHLLVHLGKLVHAISKAYKHSSFLHFQTICSFYARPSLL